MFARLTFYQVQPDSVDEAIRIFRSFIPAAKKQAGFRGACLLVDRAAAKGISVTFWRTQKDLQASEENRFYAEQLAKALHLYVGPPFREGESYEVTIHSMSPPAKKPARRRVSRKKKPKK